MVQYICKIHLEVQYQWHMLSVAAALCAALARASARLALSLRATASTRSTPISAFPAVPAPISAPPTLSRKANLSQTRIGLRKCLRRLIFCCIMVQTSFGGIHGAVTQRIYPEPAGRRFSLEHRFHGAVPFCQAPQKRPGAGSRLRLRHTGAASVRRE
mgnify:CR=1 FL=1